MGANFKNLQVGNVLSETQYYKVEKIVGNNVQLGTDDSESIVLDKGYVEKFLTSAHDVEKTEKVSRTEMAEILLSHPRIAITVCYNKQVKEADVVKEIMEAYANTAPKEADKAMKKAVKKALEGEERVMVGRHYGSKDDFGRLHFVDMEQERGTNPTFDGRSRLVDPRTLNWIIANNVKYVIK